jgi:DNA-binding response OmpR family regulator
VKKKILIIDDEPDIIMYLRTFFKDQGYNVCCAEDVKSASRMMNEEKPDLICLDIMMPEKSGVSFYDQVRTSKESCDIPVIIISGLNDESMAHVMQLSETSGQRSRYCRFVSKPVDLNQLLSVIKEYLG